MADSSEKSLDAAKSDSLATVASSAVLVFGGRIAKLGTLFLAEILVARLLGTSSYGGVVLAYMFLGVVGIIARLGLPDGLQRNVPQYEDDRKKARGVIKAGFQFAFVLSILLGVSIFFFAPTIATVIFEDASLTPLFRIAAIGLPLGVVGDTAISIARGSRDAKTHVIVRLVIEPILRILFVATLILVGYGAVGAVAGRVLSSLVTAVLAIVLLYRVLPYSIRGPTTVMHRELLNFSLPLMFSSGMNFLIYNIDTLLLGMLLESNDVGVYNVAFQFRSLPMFFFFSLAFLLPPVITRLNKNGKQAEMKRVYQVVSRWMVLTTLPVFFGMMFFPDIVIGVTFGEDYQRADLALRVLLVPVIISVVLGANEKVLVALGHNKINFYVNAIAAALNLVLNLLFIPRYGILGAAIATAVSIGLKDLAFGVVLFRWERIHPFSNAMLRPVAVSTVVAILGYVLTITVLTISVPTVVSLGLAFVLLYGPLVVVSGGIESEDKWMLSLLEGRLGIRFERFRAAIDRMQ